MVEFSAITPQQTEILLKAIAPYVFPDFGDEANVGGLEFYQPIENQPRQVSVFDADSLDIRASFTRVADLTEISRQILDRSKKEIVFPSGSFNAEEIRLQNKYVAVGGANVWLGQKKAFLEINIDETPEALRSQIKTWYNEQRDAMSQGAKADEFFATVYQGKTLQDMGEEKSYKWVDNSLPSLPKDSLRARKRQAALNQVIFGVCGIACVGVGIIALRHFYPSPRITA